MEDGLAVAVRFGLYLDLMVLFGLPLFTLYGLRGLDRRRAAALLRRIYTAAAVFGLLLSALGFAQLTASMSGLPITEIDFESVRMLLDETSVGKAWQARIVALAFFLGLAGLADLGLQRSAWTLSSLGGVALASLAWAGHGAMSEGAIGIVHLTSDIIHLLAAGVWIAALLAFGVLLFRPYRTMALSNIRVSHRALTSFAFVGTVVVSLLVITGLVNSLLLVGVGGVGSILTSLYGQLLIAKLLLFLFMLCLAALNRFRMTPALEAAIAGGDRVAAVGRLRLSLVAEAGSAVIILLLVAWLGKLAPPVSSI